MGQIGATPYPFSASGVVGPVNANGFIEVHGITARETVGSSAVSITLRENTSGGKILAEFNIPSSGSLGNGLLAKFKANGSIYAQVAGSGTLSAVLYIQ